MRAAGSDPEDQSAAANVVSRVLAVPWGNLRGPVREATLIGARTSESDLCGHDTFRDMMQLS